MKSTVAVTCATVLGAFVLALLVSTFAYGAQTASPAVAVSQFPFPPDDGGGNIIAAAQFPFPPDDGGGNIIAIAQFPFPPDDGGGNIIAIAQFPFPPDGGGNRQLV